MALYRDMHTVVANSTLLSTTGSGIDPLASSTSCLQQELGGGGSLSPPTSLAAPYSWLPQKRNSFVTVAKCLGWVPWFPRHRSYGARLFSNLYMMIAFLLPWLALFYKAQLFSWHYWHLMQDSEAAGSSPRVLGFGLSMGTGGTACLLHSYLGARFFRKGVMQVLVSYAAQSEYMASWEKQASFWHVLGGLLAVGAATAQAYSFLAMESLQGMATHGDGRSSDAESAQANSSSATEAMAQKALEGTTTLAPPAWGLLDWVSSSSTSAQTGLTFCMSFVEWTVLTQAFLVTCIELR